MLNVVGMDDVVQVECVVWEDRRGWNIEFFGISIEGMGRSG